MFATHDVFNDIYDHIFLNVWLFWFFDRICLHLRHKLQSYTNHAHMLILHYIQKIYM